MERIDSYLVNKGFVSSRSKAAELIKNNLVYVNDKIVVKNSLLVDDSFNIEIKENNLLEFVSRGGLKLEKALQTFNISLNNKVICDIGASTGGFTSCALKHNASFVYAIDVGTNQLHESLKKNSKVKSLENLNFKDVTKDLFDKKIDLYVCDVSFISIKQILNKLKELEEKFQMIFLFKPQFEVGKNNLNKKGVVKNDKILLSSLNEFEIYLKDKGFSLINVTFSPIKGNKEGNIEFLYYINSEGVFKNFDYNYLIKEANMALR